jgi:hypothetical protein
MVSIIFDIDNRQYVPHIDVRRYSTTTENGPGRSRKMFEIHPGDWSLALDANGPRDQFHETAVHEARVATEARGITPTAPSHESFMRRLRLVFMGGPAVTEPCNCPA